MADLVEDREAVVEEVVEDVVEQVARPLREELLAELVVLLAAREEARHRQQLDRRQRDEVAVADEEVELGRVQPLDRLVVDREVEDAEQVVRVLVHLRPLPPREHVLEVEWVPAEAFGEQRRLLERRRVEVDPGQAVGVELCRRGSGRAWTSPACERGRVRLMRGRLGTGTEGIVDSHLEFAMVPGKPGIPTGCFRSEIARVEPARTMIRAELSRLVRWSERHERLVARVLIAMILTIVVDLAAAVLIWLFERHAKGTEVRTYGQAVFFTSVQVLVFRRR